MRNHPDQSEFAAELGFWSRVGWAAALTRDFSDIYASRALDRDLVHRILALEDRRFFKHKGVDWRGLCREILNLVRGKKAFGASTITMQLVRIATGDFSPTVTRKIVEILAALEVERRVRKWKILSAYYNTAYIGSGVDDWDRLSDKIRKVFGAEHPHFYEIMASCLASPIPSTASPEWVDRTESRANRIAYALSAFPLSVDDERIIINNLQHVPIKGVSLSV